MLGKAVRMYNSDAVVFSGGCNMLSQTCAFPVSKQILIKQPSARFAEAEIALGGFSGRMGHTLV